MSELTLLEQLDTAEQDLREALSLGTTETDINALSALCTAAAARCLVTVEDLPDAPRPASPVRERAEQLHDEAQQWATTEGRDERVFVVTYEPGPMWTVDGPHGPDADLTRTYQILNRLCSPPIVLRLTIRADGWPEIVNVTDQAKSAGKAPPLPSAAALEGHRRGADA